MLKVKTCFDCKMFDVTNWVSRLNGEDDPRGTLSHEALKEHWGYPQSLETLLPWSETISAHLKWWQNPANVLKGSDLHAKNHSIPTLYRRLEQRLGCSLRANHHQRSVVRQGKNATHKCSRVEGGFSGSSKVQGRVPEPDSVGCD